MSVTIEVSQITTEQETWIHRNIGPRTYYLHTMRGGKGWRIRINNNVLRDRKPWAITFDDDKMASLFVLKWS